METQINLSEAISKKHNEAGYMLSRIKGKIKFIDDAHVKEIALKGETFMEQWMLLNISRLPYRQGLWLDIGAHVGNHTVYFSTKCKADEVWAYEPTPSTFEVLKENVSNNPGCPVKLFNCAVGSKKGTCGIFENKRAGRNKVLKNGNIPMEIIGDISAKVALIKIDVEGFEFEVLKGGMKLIERDLPELFIETFEPVEKLIEVLPKKYRLIMQYNNAPTYHFSAL